MKVATRTVYDNIITTLSENMTQLQRLSQQATSGKRVNQPSDDPVGAAMSLDLRSVLKELDQYKRNIDTINAQLNSTESSLLDINQLLTEAKGIAEQMATGTYTAENRTAAAFAVTNIMEEVMQIANIQLNGRYLFSGYKTDTAAIATSSTYQADTPEELAGSYDGALSTSGTPSSTWDVSRTYVVEIRTAGTITDNNAEYRISVDGGKTWDDNSGSNYTLTGGSLDLQANVGNPPAMEDSGVDLTFSGYTGNGTLTVGDKFLVRISDYQYQGDDNDVNIRVGQGSQVISNVTGQDALFYQDGTIRGDVFAVLDNLRYGLENDDIQGIGESLDDLDRAQENMLNILSDVGARLNRMEIREDLIDQFEIQNKQRISDIEDADLVEIMTKLQGQQVAYQAALQSAAMISRVSLVDYL